MGYFGGCQRWSGNDQITTSSPDEINMLAHSVQPPTLFRLRMTRSPFKHLNAASSHRFQARGVWFPMYPRVQSLSSNACNPGCIFGAGILICDQSVMPLPGGSPGPNKRANPSSAGGHGVPHHDWAGYARAGRNLSRLPGTRCDHVSTRSLSGPPSPDFSPGRPRLTPMSAGPRRVKRRSWLQFFLRANKQRGAHFRPLSGEPRLDRCPRAWQGSPVVLCCAVLMYKTL